MLAFLRELIWPAVHTPIEESPDDDLVLPGWLELPAGPVNEEEFRRNLASWDAEIQAALQSEIQRPRPMVVNAEILFRY